MARRMLKGLGILLLAMLAIAIWLAATPLPRTKPSFEAPTLVGPVSIVDAEAGKLIPHQAIAIRNGRIARIVPAAELGPAERRALVTAGGAFAAPGLWDMHAILTRYAPATEHPVHLAHGVTRLRNILHCPAEDALNLHPCRAAKALWNRDVAAGVMMGPIVMGSGSYPVAGPGRVHPDAPNFAAAATAAEARQLVRRFGGGPSDHIKTYDGLPRASFFALTDEARRRGVEVGGHVPAAVSIEEAAASGFKAIAHARALPIGCSSREGEIMRLRSGGAPAARWMRIALASQDPAKCAALWTTLRRHEAFVSPTLITRYNETAQGVEALAGDPETSAVTPGLVELIWHEDLGAIRARPAEEERLYRDFYRASAARTAEAARAGVSLLLGTDTNDAYVAPGIGLHREIELWRAAGIPNARILKAATADAARYFGRGDRMGRIAPGHVADILFLSRNPLEDLSVLRRPGGVMIEGKLYRRRALDEALQEAKRGAASWRYTVHFLSDLIRNPFGFAS